MQIRRLLTASTVVAVSLIAVLGFTTSAGAASASGSAGAREALQGLHVPGTHGSKVTSGNWSGYADLGNTKYTQLSSSWVEPAVTCSSTQLQLAAFWVGIDGYSSSTVEQDGTLAECYEGEAYYYSWWEMYPSNSIQEVGDTVTPGDQIKASVVRSGTSYTLKLTDKTHPANSFTEHETCAASTCVDSSSEWIAEAPSNSSGPLPLADFGKWTTTGASATAGSKGNIASFPYNEITMVGSGGTKEAVPGALTGGGTGFSVTWKNS